jgi:mRNA interferase MazF
MARLRDIMRSASSSPKAAYCPDAGDIIRIDFDPQVGREQAERRPALVLSPRLYNEKARLCVLCPIANQAKNYPFEVPLPDGHRVTGVVLADQIKSFSWEGRRAEFICAAPNGLLAKVRGMIKSLILI